ncbi:MAG: hypothetical protein LUF85_15435 [Bacteroides sp.]|nr:hypothetical protein [Bacteroides sp.]
MTDAYNDIDYNSLVRYGGIMSRIGELEERNQKVEDLKNEFNKLLNYMNHD